MWFELILAAALVVLYVVFWAWHSQGAGKLTQAEIDQYLAIIEKLPLPEKGVQAFIARLRPWAEADDGKPVYMFNLMHFLDRKSTRLNSSHRCISYAVFCLKKKKKENKD